MWGMRLEREVADARKGWGGESLEKGETPSTWGTQGKECSVEGRELYNTVATSHIWQFKFKLIKIKNSVPQWHQPHFKCSVATRGRWLPYCTAQVENISIITETSFGYR